MISVKHHTKAVKFDSVPVDLLHVNNVPKKCSYNCNAQDRNRSNQKGKTSNRKEESTEEYLPSFSPRICYVVSPIVASYAIVSIFCLSFVLKEELWTLPYLLSPSPSLQVTSLKVREITCRELIIIPGLLHSTLYYTRLPYLRRRPFPSICCSFPLLR